MNKIAAAHITESEIAAKAAAINTTRFAGVVAHVEDMTLVITQVMENGLELGSVRLDGLALHSWELIANSLVH